MKNNNKYQVGYALDGSVSEGAAEGKEGNGVPGAQITRENADFRAGLAGKKTMTFSFWGAEILKIDPRGSEDTIKAMLACQAEQG